MDPLSLDNVTLMENNHEAAFMASARWLLKNQDPKGGWSTPVRPVLNTVVKLKPGWYSSMAQGQAMSVLTRAYHITKNVDFGNSYIPYFWCRLAAKRCRECVCCALK